MDTNNLTKFLSDLISINSVTGNELEALIYLENELSTLGLNIERIPVAENRYNLFCTYGNPDILFTTHIDVVPALDNQFLLAIKDGRIYGRGACDAKGVLVSMIFAIKTLIHNGHRDMALLVVVGEEIDGIGAITASKYLADRKIKYTINGEPTEGKLVSGHKGGVCFNVKITGRSCHSGYPEQGEDANKKLIELSHALYQANWGEDPILGKGTINLGEISGGKANNIVSDLSNVSGMVRTVGNNNQVTKQLRLLSKPYGEISFFYNAEAVKLKTLPSFETGVVAYCTDIPQLLPIGGEFLMYGPGTINEAHTVNESIAISELEKAVDDYQNIYRELITLR